MRFKCVLKFIFIIPWFFLSCQNTHKEQAINNASEPTLFQLLDTATTKVNFVNALFNTDKFNIFTYRNFYNGGGVGIIDINNDGLKDLVFTGNQVSNKLYLNKGNLIFEDITQSAGFAHTNNWSTGVSIVDINQDGYQDIYISNAGYTEGISQQNELFINNGDNTFTEKAAAYQLNDAGYTTHAAFFDYDADGDLDAYILNNSFIPVNTLNYANKRDLYAEDWDVKEFVKGGGDKLLRNDGGTFTDVSKEAGIYGSLIGFGLGVTVGDVNGDRLPDIYVSNDFFERDYLYINQGNGTFNEEVKKWLPHMSLASMGADMADINNDGLPEIFTTEMLPATDSLIKQKLQFDSYNTYQLKLDRDFHHQYMQNSLQLNEGNGRFSEVGWYANVAQSDWSWGALIFDADLDGMKDIFVCNGVYQDVTDADFMDFFANEVVQKMVLTGQKEQMQEILKKMPSNPQPNKFFQNKGNLKFEANELTAGLSEQTFSNGAAYADLDNDGDLDLVINNLNQASSIYENTSNRRAGHYISLNLQFQKPNIDGLGSKIYLYAGEQVFTQELMPTRGFQSSVDYTLNFGLGTINTLDSLLVVWPNGYGTSLHSVGADTILNVSYSEEAAKPLAVIGKQESHSFFTEVAIDLLKLKEDDYVDFYYEGLIINKLSKEGPAMAVSDLNGDALDDIVLGTPAGQPTMVYLQEPNGSFKEQSLPDSEKYEDTALHIFDANGDGKLDIFIGSGGNHLKPGNQFLTNRLYSQGDDNMYTETYLLKEGADAANTSVACSFDYDNDGDLDLFVGNRSIPKNYGTSPKSYLYENNGDGTFKDMTLRRARAIDQMGMVTDAKVADLNGDGIQELIVVGDWMGIKQFEIKDKQLIPKLTKLDSLHGWWNTIEIADLNNDKLPDLILGNRGENFPLKATAQQPVKLFLQDFDGNGQVEKVLTKTIDGRNMPTAPKKELTAQVPSLRKQNLKNSEYASKSVEQLFGESLTANADVKQVSISSSIIAINKGRGKFDIKHLPKEAQYASLHTIYVDDFNQDGQKDLLVAGNDSNFIPQFSKIDANQGLMLLGDGSGQFTTVPYISSALNLTGDVKNIIPININGQKHLLIAINNEKPRLFKLNQNTD